MVTNPGSNLPQDLCAHYDIEVTPQQIVVDGTSHDTRPGISFEQIDTWVRTAKVHPHVLGTTAAEFVSLFTRVARRDREILAVMTSRKIIGSHDAAVIASRSVMEKQRDVRIAVGDTGTTDLGAGLACLLAAEARNAGLDLERVAELVEAYRTHVRMYIMPKTLEYLVKGGRASSLRAFFAGLFGLRPLLSFVDGELKAVGKIPMKADIATAVASAVEADIGRARPVWAAIFHGGAPTAAAFAAKELRTRFDVRYLLSRPISPSIYVHGGPECLGVVVLPLDGLPWKPTRTPPA